MVAYGGGSTQFHAKKGGRGGGFGGGGACSHNLYTFGGLTGCELENLASLYIYIYIYVPICSQR